MKERGYWNDYDRCLNEAKRYQNRKAFIINSGSAYNASKRNGWLDDICCHMKSQKVDKGYWNLRNCKREALKYTKKSDFIKNKSGAYDSARKNGWLEEICSHMVRKQKQKGYWTSFENCMKEASKFNNISDFHGASIGAYESARRNGWLIEICRHMQKTRKPTRYWNYENCKKEALKYKYRSEFNEFSRSAYKSAERNKWLDSICTHMQPKASGYFRYTYAIEFPLIKEVYIGITYNLNLRKHQHLSLNRIGVCSSSNRFVRRNIESNINYKWIIFNEFGSIRSSKKMETDRINAYFKSGWIILNIAKAGSLGGSKLLWNKNKCCLAAKLYSTRSEFSRKSPSAYNSARDKGWLNEICKHMNEIKKPNRYWDDFDRCKNEALLYKSRVDFRKGSSAAYKAAIRNGWIDDICKHIKSQVKPVGYWNYERCKSEALSYATKSEFMLNSKSAYTIASKNNWLKDICIHMTSKRKENGFWSVKENCMNEALKYKTRIEFCRSCNAAYKAADKHQWLEEICQHMPRFKMPKGYWTIDKCNEIAKQYMTKMDFRKGNAKAYDAAREHGWLDKIFYNLTVR